jgi:hypothetical protein
LVEFLGEQAPLRIADFLGYLALMMGAVLFVVALHGPYVHLAIIYIPATYARFTLVAERTCLPHYLPELPFAVIAGAQELPLRLFRQILHSFLQNLF